MIIDPQVTEYSHVDEVRAALDQLRDEIGEPDEIAREVFAEMRQWIEWDLHQKVLVEGRPYSEVAAELGISVAEPDEETARELDRELDEVLVELDLVDSEG